MVGYRYGTHDRGGSFPSLMTGFLRNTLDKPEYIRREVAPMTAADIILILIGIIGLLIAFGSFVIALLAFLDRDKDYKRKK